MSRRSNTEERKQQIVAGMRRVMAAKGYDRASIGDVAEAAGLSAGLVHYHFANKLEILLAVLEQLSSEHDTLLDRALEAAAGDPRAELDALIDAHLAIGKHADPDALACWIMLSTEAMREPAVRERYAAVLVALADRASAIIRRGARAKLFSSRDIEASAAAIVAAIEGYYVVAAIERALIPRGSAARSAKRMVRGLLAKARSTPQRSHQPVKNAPPKLEARPRSSRERSHGDAKDDLAKTELDTLSRPSRERPRDDARGDDLAKAELGARPRSSRPSRDR